jgi:predicted nucleic acid-binding protein
VATIDFGRQSRIYVDANIWIYLIEGNPQFVDAAEAMLAEIAVVGSTVVTSEITIAECIWKPSRTGDQAIIELYDALFASDEIELAPLDGALAKRAAMDGGGIGLKLIDAIHYVTALESHCDFFLTGDRHFKSVPSMEVIHLTP